MLGPIAYNPVPINSHKDGSLRGHLDISKDTGRFSSKVIINGFPSGWNLSYIDGAYWDGQALKIDVPTGETLILQPDGNIALPKAQPMSFLGPITVELEFDSTLSPNGNSGGWELTNVPFQLNGCDVATKCYVDRQFQIAGFNQNGVTETITESAWVCLTCFFNAPIIELETISELVNIYKTSADSLMVIVGEGPITESVHGEADDDFSIVFVSSTDMHVSNNSIVGVSSMPVAYWGTTQNWYVDGVLQGTVAINASGVFSFDFNQSAFTSGAHTLSIGTSTPRANEDFIV